MKIKNGFIVKSIAGQNVVMALGEASKIFNGVIKLGVNSKRAECPSAVLVELAEKLEVLKSACVDIGAEQIQCKVDAVAESEDYDEEYILKLKV